MNYLKSMGIASVIGTGLYALYMQFSPGLGGILIRPDSDGNKVFTPGNLFNIMVEPLKNARLWDLENLDMNYIVVLLISLGCGALYAYSQDVPIPPEA
jgi:hypothetical protein